MAQAARPGYDPAMNALRPLLALFLSLSLIWASAHQVLAHAGMPGGIAVTLCDSSGQEVTVHLNANGDPVTPHDCTDCLAAQAQAILPAPPLAPAALGAALAPLAPFHPFPPLAAPALYQAQPRAPPTPLV